MGAKRRGGRDLRLTLLAICAVAAMCAVVVSGAAAAQYTVVDLGPQGTEAGPSFEGAVIGISPSGLQVATNCGAWELGKYVHDHPAQSADADDCALGAVNSSDEVVGEWGVPESGSSTQAFSESPVGATDDDFLTAPLHNEDNFPDPADSAESIDDAGEVGGGVKEQPPPPAGITNDAYIFDPNAASGGQVQLFANDYAVFGLWPDWAEIETQNAVPDTSDPDIYDYITLYDRLDPAKSVQTDLATPSPINPGLSGVAPGSSLGSDGTLVGPVISDCSLAGCTLAPTMRLADGTETTLSTTGYNFGEVDGVNASHYSVGEVQLDYPPVAALWNPEGQLEILNNLIPAGSGWDLQNAVAIANDGAIAGTGTLDVDGTPTPENFLLTNNSLLPTTTTGACVPATVAPGKTTSCTFTVADTTPGATQKPTGTVTVASDQPGAISPSSQCTLAASAAGKATCAVTYTPTLNGTPTLTGSYSGDGEHGSSHGTASVTVGSGGSGPGSPKAKITKPKTSGTSAGASVSCAGSAGGSCTVTLTLSVTVTLSGHNVIAVSASKRKPKKSKRTLVLGSTTVKLAAGKTKTVTVSLNATGKQLLVKRHILSVKLTAAQKAGTTSTFTVKFTARKNKRK